MSRLDRLRAVPDWDIGLWLACETGFTVQVGDDVYTKEEIEQEAARRAEEIA